MPIFMIGTQRSGSNLLRLMLNQSPRLAAPHPPHVLQRMKPLLAQYGDLDEDANFALLVDDVCRLVNANPVAWRKTPFDAKRVRARCADRSLLSVMAAIYDQHAADCGAADWVNKSLANVHYLDEIAAHFGGAAKFIYLYRDGRDVALSFQKAVVGEKHVYSIAKQWHRDQQTALAFCRAHEASVLRVAYEELTSAPQPLLERACDFLGIRFDPAMIEAHVSDEAAATSSAGELWCNVRRPVLQNSGKFLREMPAEEIRIFEIVAGASLCDLGYALVSGAPADAVLGAAADARFEEQNRRLKREFAERHADSVDLKNRTPQERVLQSIRDRAG